ncbi:expressed unknown protein [Ectocarpus siliculosus]|uniref:Uncharacterized protein n=1 Tax=Ectocarpus siliculosus TaxID=2880 RepID=D8LPY0_ECTSI|nr:expressed unknown protein [Ectocarpus siliculosus]|eukprot:CBN74872.1 expressed unknown protein [Ectocarpus siliculosus]
MVGILAALFNDLEERYSTTYGQDPVVDDAVLGFIQRIKDIGQGMTVFTVSRLQTHSLISNTVQLCHRMAGDQHSQLAKDYPSVEQVEYDTYDQSTDDGGRVLEDDDSDDDDDDAWGGRDQRARSPAGGSVEGTGASGGGAGGENGAAASNPAKRRKRSSGGAVAGDGGGGASSSGGAADGGGANVGEEVEEGFEDMPLSSAGKGKKKGKGKPGAGAGAENGTKKEAKEREGEARKEEVVAGLMVRERYHAVVIKLVARSKWASEPAGRAHKDVITRAREVIMTIFIDSFHRRLLSLHRLVTSLDQLDRMIAWADDVEEGVNAKEAGVLGPGMPMSEIGLTNIALTVPE